MVTSGTSRELLTVEYLNGQFVVVGGGAILTSKDGEMWNPGQDVMRGVYSGVASDGEQYLVVGLGTGMNVSHDGSSWGEELWTPAKLPLSDIAYGSGTWVAVGNSGTILVSATGDEWTLADVPTERSLVAVTFAQNQFVAVGEQGTILVSKDGVTWNVQASNTNKTLHDVVFHAGQFVAVGGESMRSAVILSSPDGVSWTDNTVPMQGKLVSVVAGDGIWVALGELMEAAISSDGKTWTKYYLTAKGHLKGIGFGNGRFVAVGQSGEIRTTLVESLFGEEK